MSWRTTGILFVVLLVVAGIAYWQSQAPEEAEAEPTVPVPAADDAANPFEGVVIEDVKRLDVEQGSDGADASFTREADGSWFMTVPTATQVMSATLTNNLTTLIGAGSRRTISPDENPLEAYGLDQTENQITVAVQRGEQVLRYHLQIGNPTPADDAYYVLKENDSRIYLMTKSLIDNILNLADNPPLPEPTQTPMSTAPVTGTATITATTPIRPTLTPQP